jgi:hypothetical protein
MTRQGVRDRQDMSGTDNPRLGGVRLSCPVVLSAGVGWRPVVTGGRTPFAQCCACRARQLNETNRLHRGGWLETTGGHRLFLCGDCAGERAIDTGRERGERASVGAARNVESEVAR